MPAAGLTEEAAAKRLGVTQSDISSMENGRYAGKCKACGTGIIAELEATEYAARDLTPDEVAAIRERQ